MAKQTNKTKKVTAKQPETAQIVTDDAVITVKPAKSTTKTKRRPKVLVDKNVVPDAIEDQVGGFINFLREHAIVGLAVGFIIGQQAQTVVKQWVDSVITPSLSFFIGQNLITREVVVHTHAGQTISYTWGKFVYILVNFFFVLLFIYVIIKLFSLDKLDQKKP